MPNARGWLDKHFNETKRRILNELISEIKKRDKLDKEERNSLEELLKLSECNRNRLYDKFASFRNWYLFGWMKLSREEINNICQIQREIDEYKNFQAQIQVHFHKN